MPSPTNASVSFLPFFKSSSSTRDTLSAGSSSLCTSSIPSSFATVSATCFRSPVSITVRVTPAFFRFSIACFACGLIRSEIRMCPAYAPSIATCTTVPTWWHSTAGIPSRSISFVLPTATAVPSTFAVIPLPPISSISDTLHRSSGFPQAFCRLLLIGCEDALSASAAYSSSF